ncbi:hypothetical protein O3P69_002511 [Scylla paramamosain]|uniref:CHK kinase-like domain-containing protein n=1 Tax=Scylla paramamosain TaxID=85552 RepID=A0AAW0UM15_SCYPA
MSPKLVPTSSQLIELWQRVRAYTSNEVRGTPEGVTHSLRNLLTLNTFQEERGGDKYRINAHEYVYGVCEDGEYLLMMQDLVKGGFTLGDKRRGLSVLQLKTPVRNLAHLHAASYTFNHTHDFLAKYPHFKATPFMTSVGYYAQFPCVLRILASNKDKLLNKVTGILTINIKEAVLRLCYGDDCTNNFMFKYDKEGVVEDFAMIDWGNVRWQNLVTDLLYVINTSTQQDVRWNHMREMQKLYYDTFTSAAANLGATLPHWRFEDFLVEYRKSTLMGVVFALFVNLLCTFSIRKIKTKSRHPQHGLHLLAESEVCQGYNVHAEFVAA